MGDRVGEALGDIKVYYKKTNLTKSRWPQIDQMNRTLKCKTSLKQRRISSRNTNNKNQKLIERKSGKNKSTVFGKQKYFYRRWMVRNL